MTAMKTGRMSCARLVILAGVAVVAPAQSPKFVISTVAGAPLATTPVPALSVAIGSLQGIAADARGNVYFTTLGPSVGGNQNALLKLDQTGTLTRATGVHLSNVGGVVVDKAGNLYLTDQGNNRVRKISTDGSVDTIAGTGGLGFSRDAGDGGPAINATLYPNGLLAIDGLGNLYVGESTSRIRKISADGTITTIAGNGTFGYSSDGGSATNAQLGLLGGLAVDPAGNLYISESLLADDDTGTHTNGPTEWHNTNHRRRRSLGIFRRRRSGYQRSTDGARGACYRHRGKPLYRGRSLFRQSQPDRGADSENLAGWDHVHDRR
jgi:hypothetical protein